MNPEPRESWSNPPKDGRLNLAGLQTVLDLRVQLGLMPPSAKELESYFDASVYREASAH
jgi:hypothetical protein